jgi:hypothetical protein
MRRSAALMLMVLSAGCIHKTQPETQPPPVVAAPQAAKPTAAAKAKTTTKPVSAAAPASATPKAATAPKPAQASKPGTATTKTLAPSAKQPPAAAKSQAAPPTVTTPATKPQPVPPAKATTATTAPTTLDLEALKTELKQTKAIGLMTKLSLKNKVDDLLADFRKHHAGKATPTLAELRGTYDLLMMKVLSLLQDRDQKLASEIVSSREQIWGLLADPKKFAALPV